MGGPPLFCEPAPVPPRPHVFRRIVPGRPFFRQYVRRRGGVRRPRFSREQGRGWLDILAATAPKCASLMYGRLTVFSETNTSVSLDFGNFRGLRMSVYTGLKHELGSAGGFSRGLMNTVGGTVWDRDRAFERGFIRKGMDSLAVRNRGVQIVLRRHRVRC